MLSWWLFSVNLLFMRILLTTTSYQDTPGPHHALLESSGFDIVRARGPLPESELLRLFGEAEFDGILNGDDRITSAVIDAAMPRLKVISKYGIGLDAIDVEYATSKRLPVLFTPGVNHTTVAEHAFGLMIALSKHFWPMMRQVKIGDWHRQTGHELFGKTVGVLGMGRVGKEVVKRAAAFGMIAVGFDLVWDDIFAEQFKVKRYSKPEQVLAESDIISLHMNLTEETQHFINADRLALMKNGAILVNTARGGLVVEADVAEACRSGSLAGYGTDVLDLEPIQPPHEFQNLDNVIITPHVGSRTFESVERQALRATANLINFLNGKKDYLQANEW